MSPPRINRWLPSDYIIDLGPDGGDNGGYVIFAGLEQIINYIKNLNYCQKLVYTNLSMGDDEDVGDINLAKAKDIVFEIKREFDKIEDCESEVIVRHYDGVWDNDLEIYDVLAEYTSEYAKLRGESPKDLMRLYEHEDCKDTKGCFVDFKFEGQSVKDIVIDDFKKALVSEFPEYFK